MAHVTRRKPLPSVKLYTLADGEIFTLVDALDDHVYMVLRTGNRRGDRYAIDINVVDLHNGAMVTKHGSAQVVHHKGAAIVLDYIEV